MIYISNKLIEPSAIKNIDSSDKLKSNILNKMATPNSVFRFKALDELLFELNLRESIVQASKLLNNSEFSFETFRKSKCNPDFWKRTLSGGFLLVNDILPSDAINDIFSNGSKYATECATAIVIIYYKALLKVFAIENFNKIFTNIQLMNWHYLDKKMGISSYIIKGTYLPGDCVYFKNPDVNPLTPEWQGENAIDLDDGNYFGHGLGINTSEELITSLNENRKNDSKVSAYLTDSVTRIDFRQLYKIYLEIDKN